MEKFFVYKMFFGITAGLFTAFYGFAAWEPSLLQILPSFSLPSPMITQLEQREVVPTKPQQMLLSFSLPSPMITQLEQREVVPTKPQLYEYVEVEDGCGPHFQGECLRVRSGPGESYPVIAGLRTGIVLKVADTVIGEGRVWYKILFNEGLRFSERVAGNWYVSADYVRLFMDEGILNLSNNENASSTKRIFIDRSQQMLYAYDGATLFLEVLISTGLELNPTPRGTFTVYRKTPSRYMQGPIPDVSDDYFDLPGVPWNLYFTSEGAVIHGAYWHDKFGQPWSHGCVNLPPEQAQKLYQWADIGTKVLVQD